MDDPPPWEHHNPTPPEPATTSAISPKAGQPTSQDTSHRTGTHAGTAGANGGRVGDVPVVGELLGDESGFVDGVVDGIPEDPEQDYLDQLEILRHHHVMIDPPLPKALILLTVPFLSAL
ncbi:hypothetical protein, partial [Arthrobacter sp. E3]|uniref:hypothetical protein n=1 Tax=Arthrobacter sp. E3 TaxID=517402 RepID=UPI001A952DB9